MGLDDNQGQDVQQVKIEWVNSVVKSELPCYGIIKMKMNDNENIENVPNNSRTWLLVFMLVLPSLTGVITGVSFHIWRKTQAAKFRESHKPQIPEAKTPNLKTPTSQHHSPTNKGAPKP